MISIKFVRGDATNPIGDGRKYLMHICNDVGGWGKGFVLALSKKWSQPEQKYRQWFKEYDYCGIPFKLGNVQFVNVENDIVVCNMIAQQGFFQYGKMPPIRYDALFNCLQKVGMEVSKDGEMTVHCPRIGTGLAGGKWDYIEKLIKETISSKNIPVIVYTL